jgi:hypothetical protein
MARLQRFLGGIVALVLAAAPATVWAGMPTPLPFDVPRILRVNDTALERLQVISFFVMTFLACSAIVMLLWNYVQREFPRLPRLSFGKAAAGVFLWGMLFIVVLTMISGARELMTPGAWKKEGVTYRLADESAAEVATVEGPTP